MTKQDTATKFLIYEPVKSIVTRIMPELAIEIGLNESIVLLQISFWLSTCNNVEDGRYWTFQTLRDMKDKAFPYWGIETIRRTLRSLADQKLIFIGNFNKRKGDRTQWFALNPDKLSELKSIVVLPEEKYELVSKRDKLSQIETPTHQNETTLPEITTEKEYIPPPPRPKPINPVAPWHDALLLCFNLKPDTVTKSADRTYWTAASEMAAIKFPVENIPDLYRWCVGQGWKSFSVMAMAKHAGEWLAKKSTTPTSVLDGLRLVS